MTNDYSQYQKNMEFENQKRKIALKKQLLFPQRPQSDKPKKVPKPPDENRVIKRRNRKKRNITRCPHTDQQHYAKGMCNHCYHLYGRNSLATQCEHTDKLNYAKGMC